MNKLKCLIFDFDGVIVDSFDAAYKIAHTPLKVENKSNFRGLFNGSIANTIQSKLSSREYASFFNSYATMLDSVQIVPGIAEVIQKVSQDYLRAIISSTTSSSINKFLKTHKLEKYFAEILGIDDGPSKEEKIRELLQTHNIATKDCLMITDTVGDIVEAKQAGVLTIGVTWGYHDEQMLKSKNPTALAHTPADLTQLITDLLPL
ncbi:MAG: HAD-IA family hydrolase [Patescibacteria group bacterium]